MYTGYLLFGISRLYPILSHTSRPYPLPPPSLFIQIYCSSSSLCNKTCRRREDKMQTTSGLEKLFCVGRTYKKLLGLHRQTHQPWISDVVLQKHQQSPYWEKNCLSLNKPTGLAINSLLNKVQDVFNFSEQEVRSAKLVKIVYTKCNPWFWHIFWYRLKSK